jgi:ABC-type glycerol-3-phosphate transport system substrate-binding protein
MDEFHAKITKVEGNNIVRMGIIPWTVYGSANSIFTWGWVFGGEFYDPDQEKITGNHPLVVKALEWMVEKYAKKYDITRIAGFQAGFGTGENHPFFVGKTSMAPFGPWELGNIKRYAPNLKYGITFIPAGPPPAQPRQSWVGGWCIGIPQGAKMVDQAWQFLRWAGGTPEGALTLGKTFSNFSGYKKNPWLEIAAKDKDLASFIEILKEAKHQRPVMPAQAFYMGALQRAVDDALYGRMTPKAALDKATEDTQRELDKILKKA